MGRTKNKITTERFIFHLKRQMISDYFLLSGNIVHTSELMLKYIKSKHQLNLEMYNITSQDLIEQCNRFVKEAKPRVKRENKIEGVSKFFDDS
jgi:hypothetical protein